MDKFGEFRLGAIRTEKLQSRDHEVDYLEEHLTTLLLGIFKLRHMN